MHPSLLVLMFWVNACLCSAKQASHRDVFLTYARFVVHPGELPLLVLRRTVWLPWERVPLLPRSRCRLVLTSPCTSRLPFIRASVFWSRNVCLCFSEANVAWRWFSHVRLACRSSGGGTVYWSCVAQFSRTGVPASAKQGSHTVHKEDACPGFSEAGIPSRWLRHVRMLFCSCGRVNAYWSCVGPFSCRGNMCLCYGEADVAYCWRLLARRVYRSSGGNSGY